jgi:hypothetical protein
VMVPIAEKRATWDLFIAWQRGRMSNPLRALLDRFLRGNRSVVAILESVFFPGGYQPTF